MTSYIEDALYGIKSYVDSNINTYLDGLETEKDDGITLTDFKEIKLAEGNPNNIYTSPVMYIYPVNVSEVILSMGTQEVTLQLSFFMVVSGGKESELVIKAIRYAEAMRQCILADTTCNNAADGIREDMTTDYWFSSSETTQQTIIVFTASFVLDVER